MIKKVDKRWGHELWLELNEFYAFKLIHMKKGNRCSLQSHEYKIEANYVIEGEAEVLLENDEIVQEALNHFDDAKKLISQK